MAGKEQLLSRRGFSKESLKLAGKSVFVRRLGWTGLVGIGDWLFRELRSELNEIGTARENAVALDIFPGSTLGRYSPNFGYFSPSHGPIPWYNYYLNTEPFREAAQASFGLAKDEPFVTESYGNLFNILLQTSHAILRRKAHKYFPDSKYPQDIASVFENENFRDELLLFFAVHGASLLNSYIPNFTDFSKDAKYAEPWDKEHGYLRVFTNAGILRADNPGNTVEYNGVDRLIHTTHHLALVTIFGLSMKHSLPYHLQVPSVYAVFPDYEQFVSRKSGLEHASFWAGLGFEVIETFRGNNINRIFQGKSVSDGLFDKEVMFDFEANRLGSLLGLYLLRCTKFEEVAVLIGQLKNPSLSMPQKKAAIPNELERFLT